MEEHDMEQICVICKSAIQGRRKHRCSVWKLAEVFLAWRLEGQAPRRAPEGWEPLQELPRTKRSLRSALREAYLAGFSEAICVDKLGLFKTPNPLVNYVKADRVRRGSEPPRARLPRLLSV